MRGVVLVQSSHALITLAEIATVGVEGAVRGLHIAASHSTVLGEVCDLVILFDDASDDLSSTISDHS